MLNINPNTAANNQAIRHSTKQQEFVKFLSSFGENFFYF
jgi:hypothetical protein